jgi:hypothetical protein
MELLLSFYPWGKATGTHWIGEEAEWVPESFFAK